LEHIILDHTGLAEEHAFQLFEASQENDKETGTNDKSKASDHQKEQAQ